MPAEDIFSGLKKESETTTFLNNQVSQYGVIGQTGDVGGEFIFVRKK